MRKKQNNPKRKKSRSTNYSHFKITKSKKSPAMKEPYQVIKAHKYGNKKSEYNKI